MLSPKTLKYLRLTHRYVSFICAGILFVYLLSGFLLNHRKEFTFMNQKKERTVDYIFQLPANKDDFTEADARKIIPDLSCNPDLYNRFSLSKNKLTIFGKEQLVIKLDATSQQAFIKEMHRPAFLTALNKLHRNPGSLWTITSDAFLLLMFILLITGLLIVPGKKGLWGIGGILTIIGILIPILIYWMIV